MREDFSLTELTKDELDKDGNPIHRMVFDKSGGFTVTGCDKCRYCCSDDEGSLVSIALTNSERDNNNIKGVKGNYLQFENCKCPNLTKKGCSLGEKRPLVCKTFPFLLLVDEIIVDTHCPAVKNYSLAQLTEFAKIIAAQYAKRGEAYLFRANQSTHLDEYNYIHTGISVLDYLK